MPKELFPINHLSQQNGNVVPSSSPATPSSSSSLVASTSSAARRPVKLPLRKHHSFHFQSSQTVAGTKQLNQLQQQQQQQHHHQQQHQNNNTKKFQHKKSYINNGPLVFKPFNGENAFKPIKPVPRSLNVTATTSLTSPSSDAQHHYASSEPRICGTSLKRHQSNVETHNGHQRQPYEIRQHRKHDVVDNDDDDDKDDNNCLTDDEHSIPSSSSSVSTTRGKRLHYADLAPLSAPTNNIKTHNTSDTVNGSGVADEINVSKKHKQYNESIPDGGGGLPPLSDQPAKRTTQYATIKFNVVNL